MKIKKRILKIKNHLNQRLKRNQKKKIRILNGLYLIILNLKLNQILEMMKLNKKKKYRLRQLEVCVCFGLFQPILECYIQMGQTPRRLSANAVTGAFE